MLSRVAEAIYWISRYCERAENVARFIKVNYSLTLDSAATTLSPQWMPLVYTSGDHEDFHERYPDGSRENVLQFLILDPKNPNSIYSCIAQARETARTVREILPDSLWEQINRFYLVVKEAAEAPEKTIKDAYQFCQSVYLANHLLVGISESCMPRDETWHFFQVGRYIERADKTSRIVDVQYYLLLPNASQVGSPIDIVRWSSLLKSVEALNVYHRIRGRIIPEKVADFLIFDDRFPRSIQYCIMQAHIHLRAIRQMAGIELVETTEMTARRISDQLKATEIETVIANGMHDFIDQFQVSINELGQEIFANFFDVKKSTQLQNLTGPSFNSKQSQTQHQSS
jgi:uncharacterized alpha-E superfamily protein